MNPVGEEGNMFSSLFDQVPAKRPADEADIAGAILYLVSPAGVSPTFLCFYILFDYTDLVIYCRRMLMGFLSV